MLPPSYSYPTPSAVTEGPGGLVYNETDWFQFVSAGFTPGVVAYFNDFLLPSSYSVDNYDTVITGSGTIAFASSPASCLAVTTGAVNGNFCALFLKDQYHDTTPGKMLWFSSRIKLSRHINNTLFLGYSDGSTSNIISFRTGASSQQLIGRCTKGTNITDVLLGVFDLSADFYTLSFVCDGNMVKFFVNGIHLGTSLTNIPLPATLLRTGYQLVTLEDIANVLYIDYSYSANQRVVGGGLV